MGILAIILGEAYHFTAEPYKNIVFIVGAISNVMFWFSFKKYLRNFSDKTCIHWVNWNIAITIALDISGLILGDFKESSDKSVGHRHILSFAFIFLSTVFILVFGVYALIRLGISLRKIKNDFIGLLKQLGMIYCYIGVIIPLFIMAFFLFVKHLKTNAAFHIAFATIGVIPIAILIVIYLNAKKYRRQNNLPVEK